MKTDTQKTMNSVNVKIQTKKIDDVSYPSSIAENFYAKEGELI